MSATILLYAKNTGKISSLITKAGQIAKNIQAEKLILLTAGSEALKVGYGYQKSGVDQIISVDTGDAALFPETVATILAFAASKYQAGTIIMNHDSFETEVAGRLSIKLQASCVTNAISVCKDDAGKVKVEKMIYGGVVTADYEVGQPSLVVTLHENACRQAVAENSGKEAEVIEETISLPSLKKKITSSRPVEKTVDLKGAQRIVSIGRGLSKIEDLPMIESLADALQAQVGCSRPLVEDFKWMKLERQVGLTGTTVAPKLYLAVGISGQIQHVVGMKDADIVVAINNNRNAPIFDVADYGIVGDLYEVVPQLVEAAKRVKV